MRKVSARVVILAACTVWWYTSTVLAQRDEDEYKNCYEHCLDEVEDKYGDIESRDRRKCRRLCRKLFGS